MKCGTHDVPLLNCAKGDAVVMWKGFSQEAESWVLCTPLAGAGALFWVGGWWAFSVAGADHIVIFPGNVGMRR